MFDLTIKKHNTSGTDTGYICINNGNKRIIAGGIYYDKIDTRTGLWYDRNLSSSKLEMILEKPYWNQTTASWWLND